MKPGIILDDLLSSYSFDYHPFNKERYLVFRREFFKKNLEKNFEIISGRQAKEEELLLFHSSSYLDFVKRKEKEGGFLDLGDTPVFKGIFLSTFCNLFLISLPI